MPCLLGPSGARGAKWGALSSARVRTPDAPAAEPPSRLGADGTRRVPKAGPPATFRRQAAPPRPVPCGEGSGPFPASLLAIRRCAPTALSKPTLSVRKSVESKKDVCTNDLILATMRLAVSPRRGFVGGSVWGFSSLPFVVTQLRYGAEARGDVREAFGPDRCFQNELIFSAPGRRRCAVILTAMTQGKREAQGRDPEELICSRHRS